MLFVLLFTRTLSRFQFVNKFKPLLDAYQGPYKIQFYYWTGLQLLIRAVFFCVAALGKNNNLIITGSILLSVIIGLYGFVKPFRITAKIITKIIYNKLSSIVYIYTVWNRSYCCQCNDCYGCTSLDFHCHK